MMKARNLGKLKAMRLGATKVMPIPGPENEQEWSISMKAESEVSIQSEGASIANGAL